MTDILEDSWLTAARTAIGDASLELLASEADSATLLVTRYGDDRTVLKAARESDGKLASLRSQWDALWLLSENPDFPGPRPLARHNLEHEIEAIEISYLPGRHPEFDSDQDFRLFGETIARLHAVSKERTLAGAVIWDLQRIARHYDDARLLRLMSKEEKRIAVQALERFGSRFQGYIDSSIWTGLLHSDSHRHNVVIEDGRGSLIDFGESGFGPLFWDLGVAIADSVIDDPERGEACRRNLLSGYTSVLPQTAAILADDLRIFEAMRSLEVMTWPVSDWSEQQFEEDKDDAIENIGLSCEHLETLLAY